MTELETKFLDKRIIVTGIETPFENNVTMSGICTRVGYNELLKRDQVCVGRTPLHIDSYDQIKLQA